MGVDNEISLVKKINSHYKDKLKKKINFDIDLELDFFSRYSNEKELFIDYEIIIGNKINFVRYDIFRKFKRRDPVDNISYTEIKKLFKEFNNAEFHTKQILYDLNFISSIDRNFVFDISNDELGLYSIILFFGHKGYEKLKSFINTDISSTLNCIESNVIKIKSGNIYLHLNRISKNIIFSKTEVITANSTIGNINLSQSDFGKILEYCFVKNIKGPKKINELYKKIGKTKTDYEAEESFRKAKSNFIGDNKKIKKESIDRLITKNDNDKYSVVLDFEIIN